MMKKVILFAVIMVFAITGFVFADCGVCGNGQAKAAGEGASHDAEHMAKENHGIKAEVHMHKTAEEISACNACSAMQKKAAGEGASHDAEHMSKQPMPKDKASKAKEASSY
jgi:hypothetical protein